MSIDLQEEAGGKILAVRLSGNLAKDDFERFVPLAERLVREQGKLRILCEIHDFHGWDPCALAEDFKFDLEHFADIERLAIVGDKQHEIAVFCKPFTAVTIRYFERSKAHEARKWIYEELPDY